MIGRRVQTCCLLAALSVVALSAGDRRPAAREPLEQGLQRGSTGSPRPEPAEGRGIRAAVPGVLILDLPSGRPLSIVQPDLVAARLAAGSIAQVATLVAALESGVISPDTPFTCRRRVTVDGRQLVCAHPDLHRPMSPAEALANSCNDFFATVAQRLSRERLNAARAAIGLAPVSPKASVAAGAVGLDGVEASPEQVLRLFVRAIDAASGARMRRDTRAVLLEGLRGASRQGAAGAIAERGIDALALTMMATAADGSRHALALAISPSARPSRAVVVVVPGGSAGDAASVVAQTLAELIEGTYWESQSPKVPPSPLRGFGVAPPRMWDPASAGLNRGRAAAKSGRAAAPTPTPASGMTMRVGHLRLTGGYDLMQVPLEDYVARVLAGEAAARSAPAALEALSIAVRTFAIANLGRHRNDGFDLCDLTHCQVMATATAATRQAAAATAGQILTYRRQPAAVFYTASCGGQSELPSDVWPRAQDQPFLTRHKDADCRREPEWTTEIAATELLRAFNAAGLKGDRIRNVRIARRSGSGRASVLRVEGLQPEEVTGDDLRVAVGRTLGWQLIKSTAFDVKRTSGGYRFTGRGYGHGVGLCVIGSTRMAAEGKSAAKILAEYFPGTQIALLAPAGLSR